MHSLCNAAVIPGSIQVPFLVLVLHQVCLRTANVALLLHLLEQGSTLRADAKMFAGNEAVGRSPLLADDTLLIRKDPLRILVLVVLVKVVKQRQVKLADRLDDRLPVREGGIWLRERTRRRKPGWQW